MWELYLWYFIIYIKLSCVVAANDVIHSPSLPDPLLHPGLISPYLQHRVWFAISALPANVVVTYSPSSSWDNGCPMRPRTHVQKCSTAGLVCPAGLLVR